MSTKMSRITSGLRRRRRASRRSENARRPAQISRSPPRPSCATIIRSGCWRCRASNCVRIHASSGTTGKPTVVGYSRRDIETWASLMARGMRAAGCRPGMLAQNSYGYGLFTGGLGFHHGAERFGMTVVPVSGGMTERQVKLIDDFKPDVIFVTPTYLLAILDEFRAQGLDPRASSLKIAMCGAEPWTNAMRAEIEERVRHARRRQLRPVGSHRPGRVQRMHRDQGRLHHLGGSFLSGIDRSRNGRGAARRRGGRTGIHLANQGSDAGDPLSHARPVAAAAGRQRAVCGGWKK